MLLVDIGNSRIKWSAASGDDPGALNGATLAPSGFAAFATAWRALPVPARVIVANVRGEDIAHELEEWTRKVWNIVPEFVRPQRQACGVANGYTDPAQLGADRWAALIGARHLCSSSVCIVDCGTALTADALTRDGSHLGGMIAPGMRLMREALYRGTTRITPADAADDDVRAFGNDTAACVHQGTLNAAVAFIERAWFAVGASRSGEDIECIITGGDATLIAPFLSIPFRHQPDLVMHGLLRLAIAV